MLEAKNLSFSYEKKSDSRKILADVTLSVKPGERVGILAPSGAGKTTLLKILGGYRFPDSGCVLVDGKPLPKTGHCPVQLIWQHPEKAVNPRLRLGKTLAEGGPENPELERRLGILPEWKNRFPQALRRDQHHAGSDYPGPDLAVFDGRDSRKKNWNGDHKPQSGASGSCLHQTDQT